MPRCIAVCPVRVVVQPRPPYMIAQSSGTALQRAQMDGRLLAAIVADAAATPVRGHDGNEPLQWWALQLFAQRAPLQVTPGAAELSAAESRMEWPFRSRSGGPGNSLRSAWSEVERQTASPRFSFRPAGRSPPSDGSAGLIEGTRPVGYRWTGARASRIRKRPVPGTGPTR